MLNLYTHPTSGAPVRRTSMAMEYSAKKKKAWMSWLRLNS
jgi:hypothetical protein